MMGGSAYLDCGQICISLYEECVITSSIRTVWDERLCIDVAHEDGVVEKLIDALRDQHVMLTSVCAEERYTLALVCRRPIKTLIDVAFTSMSVGLNAGEVVLCFTFRVPVDVDV